MAVEIPGRLWAIPRFERRHVRLEPSSWVVPLAAGGVMSESASSTPRDPEPRWLSPDERTAWLSLVGVMVKLPAALDAQLQRDSGLSYFEYLVLAMLSEQPNRLMRMSELAAAINASLSRLSHIAKRLEGPGFITRQPDPVDGRYTNAVLTDAGMAAVVASAPGHVT